jgi:ABC-type Fe3+/spermidine/putrescine transport system ATPase subunit
MIEAPLLSLRCVSRHFPGAPAPAVDTLSLDVPRGTIVALLGPSGCGKTTTLRLIAGFDAPDAGEIFIDGQSMSRRGRPVAPEARHIGFVFQDFALFPHLTVRQNLTFGLREGTRAFRDQRVEQVLQLCGLDGLGGRYPHELSGGQQQRVALARALAPDTPLVLLDEPLGALDATLRKSLRTDMRQILRRAGTTAVLVTHDHEEAFEMADQVAIMHAGRLEQLGTPAELVADPRTPFVAQFVGAGTLIRGTWQAGRVTTPLGDALVTADADPGVEGGVEDGAAVDVLLRPWGLDVLGDLLLGIPATVDDVIFTGSHWHVYLDFGNTRFVADLPMQWPPPPAGASIRVRPSPGPTVGFCGERRLLMRWAAFTD